MIARIAPSLAFAVALIILMTTTTAFPVSQLHDTSFSYVKRDPLAVYDARPPPKKGAVAHDGRGAPLSPLTKEKDSSLSSRDIKDYVRHGTRPGPLFEDPGKPGSKRDTEEETIGSDKDDNDDRVSPTSFTNTKGPFPWSKKIHHDLNTRSDSKDEVIHPENFSNGKGGGFPWSHNEEPEEVSG